jgi:poly(3-hydroxybutyrate) depolymerase
MVRIARLVTISLLLLWSVAAAAQQLVHFPSFEDNGPGQPATLLNGYLLRPTGEGQHPAVIFLHGCGGLFMSGAIEPGN